MRSKKEGMLLILEETKDNLNFKELDCYVDIISLLVYFKGNKILLISHYT